MTYFTRVLVFVVLVPVAVLAAKNAATFDVAVRPFVSTEVAHVLAFSLGVSDLSHVCNGQYDDPALRELLLPFSGSIVRIASAVDSTTYDPRSSSRVSNIMTGKCWNKISQYYKSLNITMVFSLNARGKLGKWSPSNSMSLMRYATERHDSVMLWEFGNEPLLWTQQIPVRHYANRFCQLYQYSRRLSDPQLGIGDILGDNPLSWKYLRRVLRVLSRSCSNLSNITVAYHHYPLNPQAATNSSVLLSPEVLARIEHQVERSTKLKADFPFIQNVWIGETSGISLGGKSGISDTFASSLWYVDQLAKSVQSGQLMFRQILYGSAAYSLINFTRVGPFQFQSTPRPDYFLALYVSQLVGNRWYRTSVRARAGGAGGERNDGIGSFGYETPNAEVGFLVWNTANRTASLTLRSSPYILQCMENSERSVTQLQGEPAAGRYYDPLQSRSTFVNGRDISNYSPEEALKQRAYKRASQSIVVPRYSIKFITFHRCRMSQLSLR